jgi:hypothetical protein
VNKFLDIWDILALMFHAIQRSDFEVLPGCKVGTIWTPEEPLPMIPTFFPEYSKFSGQFAL